MKRLPLFEAVAILVGTTVGAGFLGIPFVIAKIGFPLGLLLILGIGALVLVQSLMVAEVALRTSQKHQIAGYIEIYLGRSWRKFTYTLVIAEGYGVLLAYMVGAGKVVSALFGSSAFLGSYLFLAIGAVVVLIGLRFIEKADLLLTLLMGAVVTMICFASWSHLRFEHFLTLSLDGLAPAYGVVLFSFLGSAAIPEAREVLVGHERQFPKAVTLAAIIPIVIYSIFTAAVLGVTGQGTTEVATIGLGATLGPWMIMIGNVLALTTISTAFMGLALSLKESFWYDLKFRQWEAWLLTITVPVILFSFGLQNFIQILLVVGAFLGGLQGIILVATSLRAEKLGQRQPEFSVPHKKIFGTLLIIVFAGGILYSLVSFFH